MNNEYTIGIIGGMGSFATADFFRRVLEAFPAEREWERPRVLIDNYCTLPSRVRAVLYGERKEELLRRLKESIDGICSLGASRIVLACNTSHIFLDELLDKHPQYRPKIIHMIECLAAEMQVQHISEAYLLATEGTILSGIYQKVFGNYGISVISPSEFLFNTLRSLIEAVKQNQITDDAVQALEQTIAACEYENVILGCTELPVLWARSMQKDSHTVFDPLESVIYQFTEEYSRQKD